MKNLKTDELQTINGGIICHCYCHTFYNHGPYIDAFRYIAEFNTKKECIDQCNAIEIESTIYKKVEHICISDEAKNNWGYSICGA